MCDAIEPAWQDCFRARYPDAAKLVLLFDCRGANAAPSLRFKEDLIGLANRLGVRLRIVHCPPYT